MRGAGETLSWRKRVNGCHANGLFKAKNTGRRDLYENILDLNVVIK